jgi:non-ribosomal peptide synthetase component F
VEKSPAGWVTTAEYSTDLFDAERVERMLGHWRVILESIASNPDQRLEEIPLLTGPERQQLLVEWNRTQRTYPPSAGIQQLFADQVARTPDAVAVVCENQSLTYRELNAQAERLAGHLASLGVGPEVLVGVCVERSPEMLVALMGILMAGGAYVPLDPDYPAERLNFILKDSRAKILITHESLLPVLGEIDPSCSLVMVGSGDCSSSRSFSPSPFSPGNTQHTAGPGC